MKYLILPLVVFLAACGKNSDSNSGPVAEKVTPKAVMQVEINRSGTPENLGSAFAYKTSVGTLVAFFKDSFANCQDAAMAYSQNGFEVIFSLPQVQSYDLNSATEISSSGMSATMKISGFIFEQFNQLKINLSSSNSNEIEAKIIGQTTSGHTIKGDFKAFYCN